jgi:hypothetical protein
VKWVNSNLIGFLELVNEVKSLPNAANLGFAFLQSCLDDDLL